MVTNLLDNAIRHNETGGHIVIATDSATDAHLCIANTGQHIEPDDVDRLFEPFVRGPANHARTDNGVGLGLSIVRAIVDAHHGQLTAAPRPSGGMEITIRLPGRRSWC
jgi:signal transduction histidine kinase